MILSPFNPKTDLKADSQGLSVITEPFRTDKAKELTLKVGYILRTTYPRYGWWVRAVGSKYDPTGILLGLTELLEHGGSKAGMYFNPKEFDIELHFWAKVKALGGELLERARLARDFKRESTNVTQTPDGFANILPRIKKKYIEAKSTDEFVDLVNKHIRDKNKTE